MGGGGDPVGGGGGGVLVGGGGNLPPAEVMIKFWKEVVKPSVFEHVERREQAILRAALCDCLTEIGEAVFSMLPQDRRLLCQVIIPAFLELNITYIASCFYHIGLVRPPYWMEQSSYFP